MFRIGLKTSEQLIDLSKLPDQLQSSLQELGEQILRDAEKTIPERTGDLKDSGWVKKSGKNDVEVGYDAPYAEVHEYGRKDGKKFIYVKSNARTGWLQYTLSQNRDKYLNHVGRASQNELRKQSLRNRVWRTVTRWFR